ncbi:hypothetical protein SeMB42_g03082 [Synchytrium endobioticum]|uniref:Uncharacterized protein n=1 Tax=Synchytrium endobioticum TaxID=286115 RepID=A0A507D9Q8_9FUNG|nr:hypothetical protein SeLEV6574_g04869 [Synchytrium endobioticum]TPX48226.1 hypothetical protein SeMB42_g03082 [Synchytrium endobioticum]
MSRCATRTAASARGLHTTRLASYAADASQPLPKALPKNVPTPLATALKQYRQWLATDGRQYKFTGITSNYVGKNGLPFPLNPYYRPMPPLSDSTREEIHKLHTTEPRTWTVGKLANDYGISFDRVRAILKLKAAEKAAHARGTPPQTHFARGMERLLQAEKRGRGAVKREQLRTLLASGLKPFFKMTEEDEALSPTDAARILQLSPFANTKLKIDRASEDKTDENKDSVRTVQVVDRNPLHKSNKKFAIRDVSDPKAATLIRETSGRLRTQSVLEKMFHSLASVYTVTLPI